MNGAGAGDDGSLVRWHRLEDEAATLAFAARLARALPPLSTPAAGMPLVVHLQGDLGAGKTTLARGLLQALGERGTVRSPTYALIAEYAPGGRRVVHLDLYRLNDADEVQALGLADHLPGSTLWLVEWPDRGAGAGLPAADAEVHLEPSDGGRRIRLVPKTPAGEDWIDRALTDSG